MKQGHLGGQPLHNVVVCIDADCFYAQVEHRRLGVPKDKPLAVQQWEGLIAVNYAARAFGVKRGDRVEEALRKCPELVCVHVETIGGADAGKADGGGEGSHDRSSTKVSLERYREASQEVMAIIQRYASVVERASIDEAYVAFKADELKGEEGGRDDEEEEEGEQGGSASGGGGFRGEELVGMEGHVLDPTSAVDLPLLLAARVVRRIRRAVVEELGFTLSAGISWNKMLAKLASARFKPNKQTVVPLSAVQPLLSTVPLSEVRGLGGKLGEAVQRWSPQSKTAADLQAYSEAALVGQFGPKSGTWLFRICRGWDEEPVTPNLKPKSMLAFKSFEPVHTTEGIEAWLQVLATELHTRMEKDREANHRRARTLLLQYRGGLRNEHLKNWVANRVSELTPMVSRSCPMPSAPTVPALVHSGMALFARCGGQSALPCTRLALGASDFVDLPNDKACLSAFFAKQHARREEEDGRLVAAQAAAAQEDEEACESPTLGSMERPSPASTEAADVALPSSSSAAEAPREDDPARTGPSEIKYCPECRDKRIPLTQEHEDFHLALKLQAESPPFHSSSASSGGGTGGGSSKDRGKLPAKKRPPSGQNSMDKYLLKKPK